MNAKRLFKISLTLLILLLAIFLFMLVKGLSDIAELIVPGSWRIVFLSLLAVECIGFAFLLHPMFFQKARLMPRHNANAEELAAFRTELLRRLKASPVLKSQGLALPKGEADPESLEKCFAALDTEAEKEIIWTAKRVFVSTALSQNGRLDALIVFVAMCRLVWRISKIYNQKPHPLEIAALYRSVAVATFLAFSLEELDLSGEISGSLGEMAKSVAPALGGSSLPFVGNALRKVTSSCLDGATNGFLLIRTGLIAKNAYKYRLSGETMPKRGQVFAEAGIMLKDISSEAVRHISRQLKDSLMALTKQGLAECEEKGRNLLSKSCSKTKSGLLQFGERLGISQSGRDTPETD